MKCFGGSEKRRTHRCKIVLLDETELIQEISDVAKGQDLLDIVYKHLNLLETVYFGLRFIGPSGQAYWLDPSKNIVKQVKNINPLTFYFGVKFYASDPCKLLGEITRYQFFLQIKQDILQSRLRAPNDLLAQLFAYAVQSELGDFDPRRCQRGYVSEFRFIANQTPELEDRVCALHKTLSGQVPATAEMHFLDKVKWLDLYGADLHPVLGKDNVEHFLGLTPSGVIVLRNKSKVGNYFWPRIVKIYRKDKLFMLQVVEKNNETNTFGFELPSEQACKHLGKCCTEHQEFFKLTQNRERLNPANNRFAGFSYSGRSFSKDELNWSMGTRDRPSPVIVRVPSRDSDAESEVSRCSKSSRDSHHSTRSSSSHHHRCKSRRSGDESGNESDSSRRRHRRRRRRKCCSKSNFSMINSEQQWKEVQRMQMKVQESDLSSMVSRPVLAQTAQIRDLLQPPSVCRLRPNLESHLDQSIHQQPRVTFQTPPTTTTYFINQINPSSRITNGYPLKNNPLKLHEISTEL